MVVVVVAWWRRCRRGGRRRRGAWCGGRDGGASCVGRRRGRRRGRRPCGTRADAIGDPDRVASCRWLAQRWHGARGRRLGRRRGAGPRRGGELGPGLGRHAGRGAQRGCARPCGGPRTRRGRRATWGGSLGQEPPGATTTRTASRTATPARPASMPAGASPLAPPRMARRAQGSSNSSRIKKPASGSGASAVRDVTASSSMSHPFLERRPARRSPQRRTAWPGSKLTRRRPLNGAP